MKAPAPIETPHYEPVCQTGVPQTIVLSAKRLKRLKALARLLNVRRPEGSPGVGALLDAIYHGKVALRRRDDPEGREFWIGMEEPESGPVRDPRCPDDWKD